MPLVQISTKAKPFSDVLKISLMKQKSVAAWEEQVAKRALKSCLQGYHDTLVISGRWISTLQKYASKISEVLQYSVVLPKHLKMPEAIRIIHTCIDIYVYIRILNYLFFTLLTQPQITRTFRLVQQVLQHLSGSLVCQWCVLCDHHRHHRAACVASDSFQKFLFKAWISTWGPGILGPVIKETAETEWNKGAHRSTCSSTGCWVLLIMASDFIGCLYKVSICVRVQCSMTAERTGKVVSEYFSNIFLVFHSECCCCSQGVFLSGKRISDDTQQHDLFTRIKHYDSKHSCCDNMSLVHPQIHKRQLCSPTYPQKIESGNGNAFGVSVFLAAECRQPCPPFPLCLAIECSMRI